MTTHTLDTSPDVDRKGFRLVVGFFILLDAGIIAFGQVGVGAMLAACIALGILMNAQPPVAAPAKREAPAGLHVDPDFAAKITSTPVVAGVVFGLLWISAVISALL